MAGLDDGTPLFAQIAERLAEEIADGGLAEGERVPSMNELAAFYQINPATAAKGLNLLADEGLLEKRRGIGMFVAPGARRRLLGQRRDEFTRRYVEPLLTEAARLGIGADELVLLVRQSAARQSAARQSAARQSAARQSAAGAAAAGEPAAEESAHAVSRYPGGGVSL
jgi:GntR family transcriptional regulator